MRYLGIAGVVGAMVLVSRAAAADVVTDWNATAVDTARKLALGPNAATRLVTITQIAVFEAVNSVNRKYEPYHAYLTPNGPVNLEAAVAQAAHDALLALAPTRATDLDYELELSLDDIPEGAEKENGIELGSLSAGSIYVQRLSDGASAVVSYPGSTAIGKWRPTPRVPEFLPAGGAGGGGAGGAGAGAGGAGAGGLGGGGAGGAPIGPANPPLAASDPHWGDVLPFGLLSPEQFRYEQPPALTSEAYATALNEVKLRGKGTGSTRTPEETEIAKFWVQATHVPFNDVARTVANRVHLTIEEKARLFALLNISLADARIATWDTKYEYGYWRPITAIRNADLDDNTATEVDPTWNSLLDTPNHPEYVSGHSATGAAGAAVLAAFFGDEIGFTLHSDSLVGVARSFDSFSEAAAENAESRVLGGIHYRFSNEAGLDLGETVADYEIAHHLRAVADPTPGGAGAGGEGGNAGEPATPGSSGAGEVAGAGGEPSAVGGSSATSGGTGGGATAGGSSGKGGKGGSSGKGGAVSEAGEGGAPSKGGSSGKAGGAGKPAADATDDSGCNCAVPGSQNASSAPWLLGLLILALRGRRKTRVR